MGKKRAVVKPVTLEIDGQMLDLRLDIGAMRDFEDATGRGVLQFIKPIFDAVRSAKIADGRDSLDGPAERVEYTILGELIDRNAITAVDIQALLWACTGGYDSAMTPEPLPEDVDRYGVVSAAANRSRMEIGIRNASRLVNISNIKDVAYKLLEVINAALPKGDKKSGAGGNETSSTG